MTADVQMSHADTDLLISSVKERPALYAKESAKHCEPHMRKKIWEDIASQLFASVWPKLTKQEKAEKGEQLNRRWRNLRACFGRELKRQKDPKWIYGISYKRRKYIYYDELLFLKSEFEKNQAEGEDTAEIDLPETNSDTQVTIYNDLDVTPIPKEVPMEEIVLPISTREFEQITAAVVQPQVAKDKVYPKPVKEIDPVIPVSKPMIEKTPNSKKEIQPIPKSYRKFSKPRSFREKKMLESEEDVFEETVETPEPVTVHIKPSDSPEQSKNTIEIKTQNHNCNQIDSTNFALSLVPMLNLLPVNKRIDAEVAILTVLKRFFNDNGTVNQNGGSNSRIRRKRAASIEIKSEPESDEDVVLL